MEVFRNAYRVPVPWKNGGGVTREVAVFPVQTSMDDFGWRVSIADVCIAGPFSRFDGVDRILTVLQGSLQLTSADDDILLGPDNPPYAFAGDLEIVGTPIDGAVRDLNVMVRRGLWRTEVCRYDAGAAIDVPIAADAAIFVAATETIVNDGIGTWRLAALDTLRLAEQSHKLLLNAGKAYLIAFFRVDDRRQADHRFV